MGKQFKDVEDYWAIFDKRLQYGSYTLWIRASSKQLCVDLSPGNETPIPYPDSKFPHPTIKLLASGKDQEPTLLAGIGLEEFPDIIDHYSWAYTSYPLARDSSIQLGAVDFHHESLPRNTNTSPAESSVIAELISFNDCPVLDLGWRNYNSDRGTRVENEWTRFSTADLPTDYIALARTILMGRSTNWSFFTTWLMQANYIFAKLGIKTNFEAFKLIKNVEYSLSWCAPEALGNGALPCIGAIKSDAYLFLCPRTSLLGKDSSEFRYPESPVYYWSLDPTGNARLSYDDRLSLGLPELELHITYAGYFWSEAVYGAVREFQKAKGFDPYTPEAARHLGIPIYGLPRDICPLWLQIFKLPLVRNFLGHVPFWRKVRWATHMGLKKCQILRRICMYLSLGLAFLLGCVYFISDGTK
ncbi:hypothetical protein FB451DRAFT_683398 [Mycena latifolia]|nr:hypothetical protein FB451DRAFT_683398 [Mycena latifolia]